MLVSGENDEAQGWWQEEVILQFGEKSKSSIDLAEI